MSRLFRLLGRDYSNVLKFGRNNAIDYSLRNVLLIILKAFSNQPHSKIEQLAAELADINVHRVEPEYEPEVEEPEAAESEQESGEVQINGKDERFKLSPKHGGLNKKSNYENGRKNNGKEAGKEEKEEGEAPLKPRLNRNSRNEASDRHEKPEKHERNDRNHRNDRNERADRGGKYERGDRYERNGRQEHKGQFRSTYATNKRHKYH